MPARLRPTPTVFLDRAGVLEMTAYLLAAVAAAPVGRWRQSGWLSGKVERISPTPLAPRDLLLLFISGLLLVTAAAREVAAWCAGAGGC